MANGKYQNNTLDTDFVKLLRMSPDQQTLYATTELNDIYVYGLGDTLV